MLHQRERKLHIPYDVTSVIGFFEADLHQGTTRNPTQKKSHLHGMYSKRYLLATIRGECCGICWLQAAKLPSPTWYTSEFSAPF